MPKDDNEIEIRVRVRLTDRAQAARQGKAERDIMRHTGHRSAATVRRYIRAAELFAPSNPAQGIGL